MSIENAVPGEADTCSKTPTGNRTWGREPSYSASVVSDGNRMASLLQQLPLDRTEHLLAGTRVHSPRCTNCSVPTAGASDWTVAREYDDNI